MSPASSRVRGETYVGQAAWRGPPGARVDKPDRVVGQSLSLWGEVSAINVRFHRSTGETCMRRRHAHSFRSRTHRTEWSWSLRSTRVARERVGWTFCFRLGPLISSQIREASATDSSWESAA